MNRRTALQTSVAAAAALALGRAPTSRADEPGPDNAVVTRARRPEAPYRVWFQPRCFHRDMSLYRQMTIDASGWLDPRLCALAEKTGLRWVYGTNHPWASSPDYWIKECSVETRTDDGFTSAGVAIDEWIPPKNPQMEEWISGGLRSARKADPQLFLVVWVTDLREPLIELLEDEIVDLAIIQGYTHTPPRYGPDASLAWTTCLRRCDVAKEADVLERTIFCFGHITDEPNAKQERLSPDWLTERAREIKRRYPPMPGVAFFQPDSPDTPGLRRIVQHCDRLSGGLWG